jgi:hypothetical protein
VAGSLLLTGAACERWSVFKAGFASASDPRYTVDPQRGRVTTRRASGGAGVAAGADATGATDA